MVYKGRVSFNLVWQYLFYAALIVAFVSGSFTGIYSLVSTVIARNYINKGEHDKAYDYYRAHFGTFISSKLDQVNEERRIATREDYEKEKDEYEKWKTQNPPSPTPTTNPEESLLETSRRLLEEMKNYKSSPSLTPLPPLPPERRYSALHHPSPVSFTERLLRYKDIGAFSFLIFLSFVFLLFLLCVLKLLHWGYFRIFLVRAVKNRLNNEEKD